MEVQQGDDLQHKCWAYPGEEQEAELPAERMEYRCANPHCCYLVHDNPEFGGYCCKSCSSQHWANRSSWTFAKWWSARLHVHDAFCQKSFAPSHAFTADPVLPNRMHPQTRFAWFMFFLVLSACVFLAGVVLFLMGGLIKVTSAQGLVVRRYTGTHPIFDFAGALIACGIMALTMVYLGRDPPGRALRLAATCMGVIMWLSCVAFLIIQAPDVSYPRLVGCVVGVLLASPPVLICVYTHHASDWFVRHCVTCAWVLLAISFLRCTVLWISGIPDLFSSPDWMIPVHIIEAIAGSTKHCIVIGAQWSTFLTYHRLEVLEESYRETNSSFCRVTCGVFLGNCNTCMACR